MRLVLLGLPGAGKGTQGKHISEKYGIPHISTGSLIRGAVASDSPLGREANKYISKGNLIPDELAIEILHERLVEPDCADGWILDGFPRTVRQAIFLDQQLAKIGSEVQIALDIRITPEEAIRRISKRRVCSQCGAVYHLTHYPAKGDGVCDKCGGKLVQRQDDTVETARKRLEVHMIQTHPVVHFYAQSGRLYSVNGEALISDVFAEVDRLIAHFADEGDGASAGGVL
ncbi:MAG: adenylate kinase [Firmicutes bacterium]|nr:adenylate kinase [Bacillota bacterium]